MLTQRGSPIGSCRSRWLRCLRARAQQKALTLLELMIVVGLLIVLVSVAFPRYQRARNAALIGSIINELIGNAKVCALINSSGFGDKPSPPFTDERGGVKITAGCDGIGKGATLEASWGEARAEGIACYSQESLNESSTAEIIVRADSTLSCSFKSAP